MVRKLTLAKVVETRAEIERYAEIPDCSSITLCRVTATEELRRLRLKAREEGESLGWHL